MDGTNKSRTNQPTPEDENPNQQEVLYNPDECFNKDLLDSIIHNIIINRQLPMLMNNEKMENFASSLILLCKTVQQILLREDSLLDLESPIKVCGDIHGQLNDLIKVLQTGGFDGSSKYLFLGDYIDRGPNSLEVICLLFALKCEFPNKIFLLRGNHESPEMAETFGFAEEVEKKLNNIELADSVITAFYDAFDCLPISALINDDIFCVHGGLSPDLERIEDILRIKRPVEIPDKGIIADLLWSDPDKNISYWGPNERGVTFSWGKTVASNFIKDNQLSLIIRAHQMAQNGIEFPFYPDKRVITVFSASNYSGKYDNVGAFIEIEKDPPNVYFVLLKNALKQNKEIEQNEPKTENENHNELENNSNDSDTNSENDDLKNNGNAILSNQNNDFKNSVKYEK